MNKILLYVGILATVALPMAVYAGPIIRTGENISIDASQVLKGDFYGLASTVTTSGPAEEDAYILAGTVTINAPIGKDLTVAGGTVQVHGTVGDDVRILGGEVVLADTIQGDVVMLGGTLTILSTASIQGDILFMGGELVVEGVVGGGIHGTADTVRINTTVAGDILLTVGSLSLGDKASVRGNVTYESYTDIARAPNAVVEGEVRKTGAGIDDGGSIFGVYMFEVFILLFAALSVYFVARARVQTVIERTSQSIGVSGLIGLAVFLILPFIGGVLMVSVLGILLGVLILVTYIALLLVAVVYAGIFMGYHAQKLFTKNSAITLYTVILGVLLFAFLGFIPFIGGVLAFGCVLITLGGISTIAYHAIRS